MPEEYYTEVKESRIEGLGLFTTKSFKQDEVVCPARLDGKRTPGGRFVNHSAESNVYPIKRGDDIYLLAKDNLYMNQELLVDYREMLDINFEGVLP
jgi:hypothetical protein